MRRVGKALTLGCHRNRANIRLVSARNSSVVALNDIRKLVIINRNTSILNRNGDVRVSIISETIASWHNLVGVQSNPFRIVNVNRNIGIVTGPIALNVGADIRNVFSTIKRYVRVWVKVYNSGIVPPGELNIRRGVIAVLVGNCPSSGLVKYGLPVKVNRISPTGPHPKVRTGVSIHRYL